jgi:hypothetical protein
MRVWKTVGKIIEKELLEAGKGVRIDRLGTFSVSSEGRPTFLLASDFAQAARVMQRGAGGVSGPSISIRSLNLSNVAKLSQAASRDRVRSILTAFIDSMRYPFTSHLTSCFNFLLYLPSPTFHFIQ